MADANKVAVTGLETFPGQGMQTAVYVKGVEQYEASSPAIGATFRVTDESGNKYAEGTLMNLKVGALIDLMSEFGAFAIHTFGRPYGALALVQALTRSEGGVLDVTKLYTVVVIQVNASKTTEVPVV